MSIAGWKVAGKEPVVEWGEINRRLMENWVESVLFFRANIPQKHNQCNAFALGENGIAIPSAGANGCRYDGCRKNTE